MHFSTIVSTAAFAAPALAGYVLQDDYMTDFYGHFNFFNGPDPTHGFVQYVDELTARSANLIDASGPPVPVKWGVDTVNKDPNGRASVRLESKTAYNKGLIVIDLEHMPFGCGTWPAFWMFGPNWPYQGEIDILEGVHEQDHNALTLHTSTGCSISQDISMFSGSVETQNCDVKAPGQADNAGCSIKSGDNRSYGAGLNDNGGGVYATEWTSDAISIWFFPRDSVPEGVTGDNPDPSTWGSPAAKWASDSCDVNGIFKDLNIIFDTTFCGDWAGNTWSTSSCASKANTCIDYVRDNPDAFTNAFWTVNALKVYQQGEAAAPAPEAPIVEESPAPVVESPPAETPVATDAPEQPAPTDAPVEQPASSEAPLEQMPTATDAPVESAPVESPVAPVESGAVIGQNPDGSLVISLGPWGTNGEGGGNGGQEGSEDGLEADTDPSAAAPSVEEPASTAAGNGGFNWPGAATGTGAPSVAPPVPSFDAGNATGYPTLPSGTGAPIDWNTVPSFSASIPTELGELSPTDIADIWETVYITQVVTVPGQGPAPTDAPAEGEQPIATVQQTIQQTQYITVEAGANTLPTTAPEAPIARMARSARGLRKRMVQHNRL